MGLRFGKSIKLPLGFRLNVSSKGVGASVGINGLRFGTGPRGTKITASVPGTGISETWALGHPGSVLPATSAPRPAKPAQPKRNSAGGREQRSLEAAAERHRRAAEREAAADEKARAHDAELRRAADLVDAFEARLRRLVSLHHVSRPAWDWAAIAVRPCPQAPALGSRYEAYARTQLSLYHPSAEEAASGAAFGQWQRLFAAVAEAQQADRAEYAAADENHRREVSLWSWYHRVSTGVLAGDVAACQAALQYLGPFGELQGLGVTLDIGMHRDWCVEAWLGAQVPEVVPAESLELSGAGKLKRKKMAKARYWDIYQDHVCSAAFRVAREIFALLPIPFAFVHVSAPCIDSATGHCTDQTILSVAFEREAFMALQLERIDPSDALARFEHVMRFRKGSGFQAVDELDPGDVEGETSG